MSIHINSILQQPGIIIIDQPGNYEVHFLVAVGYYSYRYIKWTFDVNVAARSSLLSQSLR